MSEPGDREAPEETVAAYRRAVSQYKRAKSAGVLPTPGFCQCILGNGPDGAETSIIDCPEHGQ